MEWSHGGGEMMRGSVHFNCNKTHLTLWQSYLTPNTTFTYRQYKYSLFLPSFSFYIRHAIANCIPLQLLFRGGRLEMHDDSTTTSVVWQQEVLEWIHVGRPLDLVCDPSLVGRRWGWFIPLQTQALACSSPSITCNLLVIETAMNLFICWSSSTSPSRNGRWTSFTIGTWFARNGSWEVFGVH